jgi:hypothetical protein
MKSEAPESNEDVKSNQGLKKPYTQPILRVYGTLQDFTRSSASIGGSSDVRGAAHDIKTH